jgi:hypothetical protein
VQIGICTLLNPTLIGAISGGYRAPTVSVEHEVDRWSLAQIFGDSSTRNTSFTAPLVASKIQAPKFPSSLGIVIA